MGLNIVNTDNKRSLNRTVVGHSNYFTISICENTFWENNKIFWRLNNLKYITGITTENISLNFSTSWDDAGGAKLGKNITSYTSGKIVKAAAGYSDEGYRPLTLTDEWTQKKLTGTEPISCSLKFKLYHNNSAGSDYKSAIKFLTHICSPVKKLVIGTDAVNLIGNVFDGGYNFVSDVKSGVEQAVKNFASNTSDDTAKNIALGVASVVNAANSMYNTVTSKSVNGVNNGNFTVILNLGDKIFDNDSFNVDTVKGVVNGKVDWIVQNFSFTPSTQFIWDESSKLPLPLWCDFNVTLETRLKLSNKLTHDLLHETPINITNI